MAVELAAGATRRQAVAAAAPKDEVRFPAKPGKPGGRRTMVMTRAQPGILAPVPGAARFLTFRPVPGGDRRIGLRALQRHADGDAVVVGVGASLARALGRGIDGLEQFPRHAGPGFDVPSTPAALWVWLRGEDRGDLHHHTRVIAAALTDGFRLDGAIDAFRYGSGRDLSGYEDGTENPTGAAALTAALVAGQGPGLDGGSFVAVQQWVHDMDTLASMSEKEQDAMIGRRKRDNEEIEDAPPSAHVKRTAQESYEPPAFILRRSMPWCDEHRAGLVFVAFGRSFAAFEALLRRMVGAEDGIPDALFRFTRPVTGSYFFCPPMKRGRLDLSALGI